MGIAGSHLRCEAVLGRDATNLIATSASKGYEDAK